MIIKGNVFLTSDTHYNHANICSATTSWKQDELNQDHLGVRKFKSLDEMNNTIIDNINDMVAENDTLIHLGDWSFGGIESIYDFRKQIKCKNIHLILGNHDQHIENNKVLPDNQQKLALEYLINVLQCDVQEIYQKSNITTRYLFTSVNHVLQVKIQPNRNVKATPVFLSHYSHRVWDKHHRGWFHAFGHSHGSLDYLINGRSIDVGIDTAFRRFGQYRPYTFKEYIDICKQSDVQIIDHHNSKTN